jgi:copper transport protein
MLAAPDFFRARIATAPLAAAGVVLAVVAVAPPAAFGHAAFVGADPEPGARLESAPGRIVLTFTEPLNRRLSRVSLVPASGGERVPASVEAPARYRLVLRPARRLGRGAYRVEWHTVSTLDGHALEGAYSFGVRAPAAGGEHTLEQSPLARTGWARVLARGALYVTLLLFAGALLLSAVLGRDGGARGDARRPAESWLAPAAVDAADRARLRARERWLVRDVGWLAAGAAAVAAVLEAGDAAGGFAPAGLRDFLLANAAGVARVAVVVLVLGAVGACRRWPGLAALLASLALGAVAVSGHASSAEPRVASVLNDWAHLAAGAVWLGGIALIALVWGPALRRQGRRARTALAGHVLPRFGAVALPAFLVVAATGLVSLVQQLGHVPALWETAYGRVLAVKIALVGLIAAASYVHALRLRPRLLASNPHPPAAVERRHWRLVRAEPVLALGVVAAVALLVTFPLPPRQLGDADEEARAAAPACDPCPLPAPAADELAVAEGAGSQLVAAWIRRQGEAVKGIVRVLDRRGRPSRTAFEVLDARQAACGRGCRRFATTGDSVRVAVTERGRRYAAELPASWQRGKERRARRLLERAEATMRRLRSVREIEEVTSGPGSFARTEYRLQAPDRMAYTANRRIDTVIIGDRQWFRAPGAPWEARKYGGGLPFRTRGWFRWTTYARAVRLLELRPTQAELALMDPATPVWFRLVVDRRSGRIMRARMITKAHYMTQRYRDFNRPVRIRPPTDER